MGGLCLVAFSISVWAWVGSAHAGQEFAGEEREPTHVLASGAHCGVERWAVKTLKDPGAKLIGRLTSDTTVASLGALHLSPPGFQTPRRPFETTVVRLSALLTDLKVEADSDLHLVLRDVKSTLSERERAVLSTSKLRSFGGMRSDSDWPQQGTFIGTLPRSENAANASMIAESPAVACTYGARFRYRMALTRRALDKRFHPSTSWSHPNVMVTLTGVLFGDKAHNQRGLAPNAIELHPLLGVRP